jgi:hypothetical protein
LKTQEKNNDEIKESNERYDIVAKATSDTIQWKIQEDDLLSNGKHFRMPSGWRQFKMVV